MLLAAHASRDADGYTFTTPPSSQPTGGPAAAASPPLPSVSGQHTTAPTDVTLL